MKIAFVNNQYQLGGAETVVRQLYTGCKQAGHESDLYVAEGKTYPAEVKPLYPRLLSQLSHTRYGKTVNQWFPRYQYTDRSFRGLKESDADVIHIHNFHGIYARTESLEELSRAKKVVWTFHRFWGITGGCDHPKDCSRYLRNCGECPLVNEWPIGGVDNTTEQLALKMRYLREAPLHIVAPSQHLARRVQQSKVGDRWPVTYIPNGVNPKEFGYARKHDAEFRQSLGISPDAITILVTNRDFKDPMKGFQYIGPALEAIDPARVELLLVGKNGDWARQTALSRFRCIDFGYVSDRKRIADLYEAADIYLYASPAENFPCVILEAMSSGCCVVSTPTDGVLEQIEDGVSGYFSDHIEGVSLGRTLKAVLERFDPKTDSSGHEGRLRVEKEFTEDLMVERHIKLYQELLRAP